MAEEGNNNPTVLEQLGQRLAAIRKKMGLTQKQVCTELNIRPKQMSFIEKGGNVSAGVFMNVLLFYTQFVSADMLLKKDFDIDDPLLFEKNTASANVAKSMIQMFREDIISEMTDRAKDLERRLKSIERYL